MTIKLVILNGIETGVEISILADKIYSIGNGDDADFYLQSEKEPFLVFFKAVENHIQWWANKKTKIIYNGENLTLSFTAQSLSKNGVIQVADREFGVFKDVAALNEAKAKVLPSSESKSSEVQEPDEELQNNQIPLPSEEAVTSKTAQPISADLSDTDSLEDTTPADIPQSSNDDESISSEPEDDSLLSVQLEAPIPTTEEDAPKQETLLQNAQPVSKNKEKEQNKEKDRKDKILMYAKILPFVLGIFILVGYGTMQYQSKSRDAMQVQADKANAKNKKEPEEASSSNEDNNLINETKLVKNNDNAIKEINGPSIRTENSASLDDASLVNNQPTKGLYASGAEYGNNAKDWQEVGKVESSSKSELETLRKEINENNFDKEVAKEILFPDEKMMSLIKEMLDSAGAQGIDVRFDRGSYDVFGYVMDDAKWQRIFKILTFDLDLSKVQFSVETSVSLLNKFEALLKKFNLSEYVLLSLAPNGQIFAKTYYPPALEGLWLTIVNRFESKYDEYTEIKEYRAHVGWIQVVKVSFDQPSYILLADGRRVVEGSVIGGDSVLDRIFEDSIRVTSSTTNIRYYVINRQSARAAAELSYR